MDLQLAEKKAREVAGYTDRDPILSIESALVSTDEDILEKFQRRLGRLHARQRLGIENDHKTRVSRRRLNLFHPRKLRHSPTIVGTALRLSGLYQRARRNAENIQIRHYDIRLPRLPASFDGFTLLHQRLARRH